MKLLASCQSLLLLVFSIQIAAPTRAFALPHLPTRGNYVQVLTRLTGGAPPRPLETRQFERRRKGSISLDADWGSGFGSDRERRGSDGLQTNSHNRSWTSGLMAANVAMYILQQMFPPLTPWGVRRSAPILHGKQMYRLVSSLFLHANLPHLFHNMYSLQSLGSTAETIFGSQRFLAIYLASGVAGNLVGVQLLPNPGLGASGAVFGVMASFLVYVGRNQAVLGSQLAPYSNMLLRTLMFNLVMGAVNPRIDNYSHIGGAAAGAAISYLFGPRYVVMDLPGGRRKVVDRPLFRIPQ